jgi:hypothetical protein
VSEKYTVGRIEQLTETLKGQAQEIATEGHAGWGNTMTFAADEIERLQQDNAKLRAERDKAFAKGLRRAAEIAQLYSGPPVTQIKQAIEREASKLEREGV